jgi:hypothetical protein
MFDSSQLVNHEKTQDDSIVQSTTTESPNAYMETQDGDAVILPKHQDPGPYLTQYANATCTASIPACEGATPCFEERIRPSCILAECSSHERHETARAAGVLESLRAA